LKQALAELRREEAAYQVVRNEVSRLQEDQAGLAREKAELDQRRMSVEGAVDAKSTKLNKIANDIARERESVVQVEKAVDDLMKERERAVKGVNAHLLTLEAQPFSGGVA
jgi:uncharacterized protein YoxC